MTVSVIEINMEERATHNQHNQIVFFAHASLKFLSKFMQNYTQ